jgi:hypothetical protein
VRLAPLLFILSAFVARPLAAVPGLNPGATVLIIGGDNDPTTPTMIKNAINALTPGSPQCDICLARKNAPFDSGIAPALVRCGIPSLDPYCQIWDMRFVAGTGTEYCTITMGGAGTDEQLYTTHLTRGGSLFLLGENAGQAARMVNMIQLLNNYSNGGLITYPDQLSTNIDFTVFDPDPLSFKSTPNALAKRHTRWPGAVPLGQTGSGRPFDQINMTGDAGLTTDWVHAFGFLPQDLTTGSGRVFVELDWTSLTTAGDYGAYNSPANEAEITAWVQNTYTWMGNCAERFTVTKSASIVPPAYVCVGDSFNYYICAQNVGTASIGAKTMWDTLPACFSYLSSSPAPASVAGNYLVWNIPSIPIGGMSCVTLTVQAVGTSCP